MSDYTTDEIEEIAIAKVKEMIRKTGNRRLGCELSENDKGPSWDGSILLYRKQNSNKVEDIDGRISVQVKGTEVKKFDNKFISYPIKVSDLKNYLADGIIYFVVQILTPSEECKVFYKSMNSMEIQLILDAIEKSGKKQKTKNVKIDSILNEKSKFDKVCDDFKKYKDHLSLALVKNAIPLNKIDLSSKLEILTLPEPMEAINATIYPFVRDEYNHLVPVRARLKIEEIQKRVKNEFAIDGKKYFDEGTIIKNEEDMYYSFGDTIHIYPKKEKVKILKSQGTLLERKKTIEFFVNILAPEKLSKEENELIDGLKDDLDIIERIISVCEAFGIDYKEKHAKDILNDDLLVLEILEKVIYPNNLNEILNKEINECKLTIVDFLNEKILLFKAIKGTEKIYINFYTKEFDLELSTREEDKELLISRFILLRKNSILCNNFNMGIVLDSLNAYGKENIRKFFNEYNNIVLELIKAWDEVNNNEYLEIASKIIDLIEEISEKEVNTINKAQIEYRLNKRISQKTLENLYKLKFNIENNFYLAGIQILVGNLEEFEETFNKLDDDKKKIFIEFPIYKLYSDLNQNIVQA